MTRPGLRRALARIAELNRASERASSIISAKNSMLEAALQGNDPKEIETARSELIAAFEAGVDQKIRMAKETEELMRIANSD